MFSKLKISTKLFLSFGVLTVLIITVGLFAIYQNNHLANLTVKMYDHPLTVGYTIRDIYNNILQIRSNLKDIALAEDLASVAPEIEEMELLEEEILFAFKVLDEKFLGDKEEVENLKKKFSEWQPIRSEIIALKRAGKNQEVIYFLSNGKGFIYYSHLKEMTTSIREFASQKANEFLERAKAEARSSKILIISILTIITLTALGIAFFMTRAITRPLNFTTTIANAVATGKLDNEIKIRSRDEIGQLLQSFADMQTQLRERIEEDKRIANEALRLNQALDTVSTSVFITNNQYEIIYVNKSAFQLFKENEIKIRQHLPTFDANTLLGACIDIFHKQPEHQRETLSQITSAHRTNIAIGELSMDLTVTPVINAEGEHLGWVSEWNDRTAEVATEREVNTVMSAASQGDFSQRIDIKGKKGFFKTLSEGLNQTLDYNQQMIEELMRVFSAIARGDLTQTITKDYAGMLEQLKKDVNATVAILISVMNAIKQTAETASQGDFSQRVVLTDKEGFFRNLSEVINQILDYNQQMVEELMHVFSAIAKGDLTQTITKDYSGALAQLKTDVNATIETLTGVINLVKQAAEAVSNAAEEMSQGNNNLSQRTEEQAASLEQTAASMEEMTGTVQQNANNTQQAAELAAKAREQAQDGGSIVNTAVDAMSEINQSSKQVADIIGVIDDIAFQTNLLALNAAVEAARAGEQGRGFAVVATEVRNLAQRSAEAAKEIKRLIQNSVGKVEEGSRLVNQSGTTLEEIVTAVRKVNDIISEIASAGQEQSSGIHQVNKAVIQMEEMTQQNAALVEEASVSSDCMKEQAKNLKNHVAFFKTNDYTQPVIAPKPEIPLPKHKAKAAALTPEQHTPDSNLTEVKERRQRETQNGRAQKATKTVKNVSRHDDHEWQDF